MFQILTLLAVEIQSFKSLKIQIKHLIFLITIFSFLKFRCPHHWYTDPILNLINSIRVKVLFYQLKNS